MGNVYFYLVIFAELQRNDGGNRSLFRLYHHADSKCYINEGNFVSIFGLITQHFLRNWWVKTPAHQLSRMTQGRSKRVKEAKISSLQGVSALPLAHTHPVGELCR